MTKLIPREDQETDIAQILEAKQTLCANALGTGKAQPLDSLVLTPTGFRTMGSLKVGEQVIEPNGDSANIIGVYPQGVRPVYRLTMKDGRTALADANHLWSVNTATRKSYGSPVKQLTTTELLEDLSGANGASKWFIKNVQAADFGAEWTSSIPPYALGLLLGNGGFTTGSIFYSTSDIETVGYLNGIMPEGHRVEHRGMYDYVVTTGKANNTVGRNLWLNELRRLGLMGHKSATKWIPKELLNVQAKERLQLLQGLLDTDGSAAKSTRRKTGPQITTGVEYSSASYQLAADVMWLVRSLGGTARLSTKHIKGKDYARVYVCLPNGVPPFKVARKADLMTERTKYKVEDMPIRTIEYVGEMETQCIMLDSVDHEYVTDNFLRTHNTVVGVESAIRSGAAVKLIVAPLVTHTGWAKTVASQDGAELQSINSRKAGVQAFQDITDGVPGWYFIGWEFMRTLAWKGVPVDFLIADEVARATNRKASQAKALKTIDAEWKLGLSATPFGNKIEGAFSVLNWLWPETYKYFWPFVGKYLKSELIEVNGFKTKKISGEREPGQIVEEIPSWMRREAPYDIPLVIHDIEVKMLPAQKKIYDQFEKAGVVWLQDNPLAERLPAVQYIRLREIALAVPSIKYDDEGGESVYFEDDAKSAKIQTLVDVLADLPEGEPHIVWTHSAKIVPIIVARLQAKGYETRGFYGATSKEDREQIRREFGSKVQIIVATIQTAGTGLDGFQDVCHVEHVLSLSDNRQENFQMFGRLSRGGQKRTVNRFVYRSLDTLEVRQNGRLVSDQQMMDASIDPDKMELAA